MCRCTLCDELHDGPRLTLFHVRELDPNHPGLKPNHPPPPSPAEESCGKTARYKGHQTVGALVPPWVVSPKRPNPALRAHRACPTVWYRRSVPNRGKTKIHPAPGGWVGAVFLGSPPTLNTHLVPPGVCGSWPLLAVWDPRFSWAHRQPTTPIDLPQHIAEVNSRSSS